MVQEYDFDDEYMQTLLRLRAFDQISVETLMCALGFNVLFDQRLALTPPKDTPVCRVNWNSEIFKHTTDNL